SRDIFCERTSDVSFPDRVVRHDRILRCRSKSIESISVECAGRIAPVLALKCSQGFSVIVAVATVDHAGRKASAIEHDFGFHNKRGISFLALPELRLFDRRGAEWLPPPLARMTKPRPHPTAPPNH